MFCHALLQRTDLILPMAAEVCHPLYEGISEFFSFFLLMFFILGSIIAYLALFLPLALASTWSTLCHCTSHLFYASFCSGLLHMTCHLVFPGSHHLPTELGVLVICEGHSLHQPSGPALFCTLDLLSAHPDTSVTMYYCFEIKWRLIL